MGSTVLADDVFGTRSVPGMRVAVITRMDSPRVIAITGGTAGVGRATARWFAREGARIGILARGAEGLAATATELGELGGKALPLDVDVSSSEAVEDAAAELENTFGPIDVWINNAMVTVFGPVDQLRPEELVRVTDVTYHGAVWGTMAALRRMRARDRGVIIQVGSALAYRPIPLQAAYCAAKHAIRAFTDALRCELIHAESHVRLTSVHLPALNTPQFTWGASHLEAQAQPVPPIYAPEVAAEAIAYASSHDRREIYVGWPTIKAVIGNKVAPGLLDHYLARTAWEGQMAQDRVRLRDESNLFEPVHADRGAHGIFDNREHDASWLDRAAVRMGAAGVRAAFVGLALAVLVLLMLGVMTLL